MINPINMETGGILEMLQELKEKLGPVIEKGVQEVKKKLIELSIKVKDELLPQWIDLVKRLFNAKNIKSENVEELTMADLISIAKKNIVAGSDGVAAYRQVKDSDICIYLSYCKGRELLSEENNCYVIIKAKSLAQDVNEMFKESDLIILN
jgi:hypothetical protein